jgi:hypothetical protein
MPENSCQHAAKIYRDGQIFVLEAAARPLQFRLDLALSQHSLCDHSDIQVVDDPKFIDMLLNVELLTLHCAFSWLKFSWPEIYELYMKVIAKELEVTRNPDVDWKELIIGGWDYTLWCLWIHTVLFLHLSEDSTLARQTHLSRWVKHISQ